MQPRELVFKVWTERDHLIHWCAPHNFIVPFAEGDLRPGGIWRSCLRSPDGTDHWVQGIYREIIEPERLVFTHVWVDGDGKPGHETIVTITLAEQDGKTIMTFHQAVFASIAARDGHRGGWSESLDRLAAYLSTASNPVKDDMKSTGCVFLKINFRHQANSTRRIVHLHYMSC